MVRELKPGLPNIVRHVVTILETYENNCYLVESLNKKIFAAHTSVANSAQEASSYHYHEGDLVTAEVYMEGQIIKEAIILPLISSSTYDESANNPKEALRKRVEDNINVLEQMVKSAISAESSGTIKGYDRCDRDVHVGETDKKVKKKYLVQKEAAKEDSEGYGLKNLQSRFPEWCRNFVQVEEIPNFGEDGNLQQIISETQGVVFVESEEININLLGNPCEDNGESFNNNNNNNNENDLSFLSNNFDPNLNDATSSPRDENGNSFETFTSCDALSACYMKPVRLDLCASPYSSSENNGNYENLNKNIDSSCSSNGKFDSSNSNQSFAFVSDNSEFDDLPELSQYK